MSGHVVTRREALKLLGALGGLAAIGGSLDACSIAPQGGRINTSVAAIAAYWSRQSHTDSLNWANWPLYIDQLGGGSDHPTIDLFEKQTGITVDYFEAIQDNGPFFATVQPSLSADQYCGYDLAVITNGIYLNKFRDLGFLVPLDQSRLPNFRRYGGKRFQQEAFDPGNTFSIPWQAGFTGIGYNRQACGRDISSWQDLLDPAFSGKIGMFANNEDLPNCALLAIGVNPLTSTEKDWQAAAAWLDKLKPHVRQFYSQNYIQALATGDVWISMAWSGDIFQQNLSGKAIGEQLKFVLPKEGGLVWTDNFVILKGAHNPVAAMELMDFYYQPRIAAMVTEWVNYVSPVPAAARVVAQDAARAANASERTYLREVATSFATFPGPAVYAKSSYGFTPRTDADLNTWNAIFEPVYES
jgi:spermidine/putrescine transport system substrate-binding protein